MNSKQAVLFLVLVSLFPLSTFAINTPLHEFNFNSDTLCFQNSDPDLEKADPILGKMGVKKGVCQGIAGLASAFFENVLFDANAPKELDTEAKAEKFIQELRFIYRYQLADAQIRVGGFSGLKEFCAENRMVFLRQSARFNAEIAIQNILPVYPGFLMHKSKPIRSSRDQDRLARFLRSVKETLAEGRLPLILVYSHVVSLLGVQEHDDRADLVVYDSNYAGTRTWSIALDADGRPSLGNRMYWNITPGKNR